MGDSVFEKIFGEGPFSRASQQQIDQAYRAGLNAGFEKARQHMTLMAIREDQLALARKIAKLKLQKK